MAEKNVVGIYRTEIEAVSAINRLLEIGYADNEISVLAKEPERFDTIESSPIYRRSPPRLLPAVREPAPRPEAFWAASEVCCWAWVPWRYRVWDLSWQPVRLRLLWEA